MTTIVQKRTIRIKRKYVYSMVQFLFMIAALLFGYLYITNTDVTVNSLPKVTRGNGEPAFVKLIYGKFGGGEFDKPMAVTVAGDRIYVADTNNKRVQVLDRNGNQIKTIGSWGNNPGQFQFPYGIALDSKGRIYVADIYIGGISVFDKDGKFLNYFAEKTPKEKTLLMPAGVYIADDKVYVTDVKRNQVLMFDINGKLLRVLGKKGRTNPGEFNAPNALTIDQDGNLYVVDTGNQRVQVFDKNGKFKKFINGSKDGKGDSIFVNPRGIGVDSRGNLYVVSNLTHFIYVFDKTGKQIYVFGGQGDLDKQFSLPNGLFIDSQDQIYITDTTNQRIAVWQS